MSLKRIFAIIFFMIAAYFAVPSAYAKEYLFKLRENTAMLFDSRAELMTEECFSEDSALATIGGVYVTDDLSLIGKYKEMGLLEYYEENAPAYLFGMPDTSEYYSVLAESGVPVGESYAQLNVNAFWKLGLSGKGVVIGVIDSGASHHTDLTQNLLSGYNTYDSTTVTTDGNGHGTMVSGLIAANGTGYRGTAYESKIVPLKAFSDTGKGDTATMADGIYKAVDEYGCDIINMSCGSLKDTETLRNAVKYAVDKGVIIVAASGNVDGTATVGSKDQLMYPACYENVISVGNIDRYDSLHNTSIENEYVDVTAPGKNVTGISNENLSGYRKHTGTSFSCPIVTGIVACMLQADHTLTPARAETLLQETATDLGTEGFDISYGYGKVNCDAIVKKLLYGKLYKSDIVEYKGTYNVAIRNGLSSLYNSFLAFANYDGNKMVGISAKTVSLESGKSEVVSISKLGAFTKFFELEPGTLKPLVKDKTLFNNSTE